MKGILKIGTLVALACGTTLGATVAQPADAHSMHWYREHEYAREQRWLANHQAYNNSYYYTPYVAPAPVVVAPVTRRIYWR